MCDHMGANDPSMPDQKPTTRWHFSMIPIYMAIGSPSLLATLVALSLGANVADIGAMTAAGAVATFVFSTVWGRLSDFSGRRKRYLLLFFMALGPVFLTLSMVNSVPQLILLYTLLVGIGSGVAPIAVMYTVECSKGKGWEGGVAKYNSITSVGNILGLVVYSIGARFYETRTLFYISSIMCLLAALLLWRTGQEPEITLERHPFPVRTLRDTESLLQSMPFLHYLDLRRIKPPRNLRQLKPLQLLLLAVFVHWVGISFFGVGQTPLMKALGLSDSLILAISVGNGVASAVTFFWIAPRVKSDKIRFINRVVVARCCLVLGWAALPIFLSHPVSFVFVFPLVISIFFNIFYAVIWLPITNFAISQAPLDRKGSIIGELMSVMGISNAIGSVLGGLAITAYGYTVGFVAASMIAFLAFPIISRINIMESN